MSVCTWQRFILLALRLAGLGVASVLDGINVSPFAQGYLQAKPSRRPVHHIIDR